MKLKSGTSLDYVYRIIHIYRKAYTTLRCSVTESYAEKTALTTEFLYFTRNLRQNVFICFMFLRKLKHFIVKNTYSYSETPEADTISSVH
jgi:hypothetical protein